MIPRILALAGSFRRDSFNKKLVPIAAHGARKAGAEVTILDLKDFPLPLFEQGMPENGKKLKHFFIEHDGLLIASPEYNSSITGVLSDDP
jgi:NAD(P)H-dependent FMN reductase